MLNDKNILKLVSVIIAIFLWFMVVSGEQQVVELTVPIKVTNTPNGLISFQDIDVVSVKVEGPAKIISSLSNKDIVLNVDVSDLHVGNTNKRIIPSDFKTPLGYKILDISPNTVLISMDHLVTKQVTLNPRTLGHLQNGYEVESIVIEPSQVYLSGAESIVDRLETVDILPINLSEKNKNFSTPVNVISLKGIAGVNPSKITANVKIKNKIAVKEFFDIPVECLNLNPELKIKNVPMISNIKISASEDIINNGLFDNLKFITDCSLINKPGVHYGNVAYKTTRNDIIIEEISPKKVKLEVDRNR